MSDITRAEVNQMIYQLQSELKRTLDNTIVMGPDDRKPDPNDVNVYLGVVDTSTTSQWETDHNI